MRRQLGKIALSAAIMLAQAFTTATAQAWDGVTVNTDWYIDDFSVTEYTITTAEQLAGLASLVNGGNGSLGNSFSGKTIKLDADIVLNNTANWQDWGTTPPANTWKAIRKGAYTFQGTFDGNGHTISGVYINNPDADLSNYSQGLFGYLGKDGIIKNLKVIDSYVKSGTSVGGIVGNNEGGTISNCSFTGIVTSTVQQVGGLVGISTGTVSNSYSTGAVIGKDRSIGGLVGGNTGTVSNSYSHSTVTGNNDYVGGLVGGNNGTISNSYSTGAIAGTEANGGLVATSGGGLISNSYYDSQTTGQTGSNNIGKTTAEMKSPEFVALLNAGAGILCMNSWVYTAGNYPVLSNTPAAETNIATHFANGDGTEANPYIITSRGHLEYLSIFVSLGNDFAGKYFKLGSSIALNQAKPWIAIGTGTVQASLNRKFSGTFDGDGHVISGVYINNTVKVNSYYQGLFGYLGSGGTIKNLGVIDSYIEGDSYIGGLAGQNSGTISNSYFRGTVTGNDSYIGGLVGNNYKSTISNSYSTGTVTGSDSYIGGLVGYNNDNGSMVSNSYSTSAVTGAKYVGGLVGINLLGTVSNSFSIGAVTGTTDFGGLVGTDVGTLSNSYYDNQTSGQTDTGKGEGKITAEMKNIATYEDWDFETIWKIDAAINDGYPYLFIIPVVIPPPPPLECADGEEEIDGVCEPIQIEPHPVIDPPLECAEGEEEIDGECEPIQIEPPPVVDPPLECVEGEEEVDGECKSTPIISHRVNPLIGSIGVQTIGGNIMLTNLPTNAKVEVYYLNGKRVYFGNPENPKILKIMVQTKGVYIVKVGSQMLRVAVR